MKNLSGLIYNKEIQLESKKSADKNPLISFTMLALQLPLIQHLKDEEIGIIFKYKKKLI